MSDTTPGDLLTIRLDDGTLFRGIVSAVNADGSIDLWPDPDHYVSGEAS